MWSTRRPRWLAQGASVGLLATCLGFSAGCAEDPYPDAIMPTERKISEEIYFILCKRVAHDAFPGDVTGQRFNNVCDAKPEVPANIAVAESAPRLKAILGRRAQILKGLDQALGAAPLGPEGGTFADGELNQFLVSLVPFYDPPSLTLPLSTRSIGKMLNELVEPLNEQAQPASGPTPQATRAMKVLETLARISQRKGYRPSNRTLGALRPILTYPRLDELGQQLLGLVSEGGAGREAFMATLRAAALELAEPREPEANPDNTTLHLVLENLVLKPDEAFAEPGEPPLWVVKRDTSGNAVMAQPVPPGTDPAAVPTPFAIPGRDPGQRGANGESPLYTYIDANKTPLAAGMREAKRIVERPQDNIRSTLENLSRGLRPWLGPTVQRTYDFNGKPYPFQGADVAKGPVFDLVHAIGVIARYDETADMIKLLSKLIGDDALQDTSASFDKMALDINETSKKPQFDSAKLVGFDGTEKTPNDFWDDLILQAIRTTKRPGQLEALVKSFSDPTAALQGKLFATWMTYKDRVTYNGAPMTLSNNTTPGSVRTPGDPQNIPFECEDCYTTAQAEQMNTPVTTPFAQKVDRSKPNYDVGMNRSIWQRTMSTINALANQKLCNVPGAFLSVHGFSFPLKLPLVCSAANAPPCAGGFDECKFIEVKDLIEIYTKSVLGKAEIKLLDVGTDLIAIVGSPFLGSSSDIQQRESQIKGFTAKPTPQSFARFIFAPRNKFLKDLLPPANHREGGSINVYEPDALFPLEVPVAAADNKSFIDLGKPLLEAFDSTELRMGMGLDATLTDGYMFANLLQVFHNHWSSHKPSPCPPMPVAGQEGCTQSRDASGKYWSPQSNVVSYEPLLYEAFATHDFTGVLQRAAATLKTVTIDGKDGLTILTNFAKRMITPDKEIAYRNGRKFAASNLCGFDPAATTAPAACNCPEGTMPADAKPDGLCLTQDGAKIRKGNIISKDGIPPIYLVLDAFKAFDKAMADPANQERLTAWKAARSNLVDQFIMYAPDPKAPGKFIIKNQRGRKIGVKALDWITERLAAHKKAGDLKMWADGLGKRFEDTFGHPIISGLLDVLDKGWENDGAGLELSRVAAYLMDPSANKEAFAGLVVAVADTLNFVDRDKDLTGVIQFASLGLASDALDSYEQGTFTSGTSPKVEEGPASTAITLSNKVIGLDTAPTLSTIGRILKNAVLPSLDTQETAIDILFDAIADVNRADPNVPSTTNFESRDNRAVFNQVQSFMLDQDRGLERIYLVVQNRKRNVNITKADP